MRTMGETYGAALIRDCLVDVLRLGMRVAFDGATGCGAVFTELRCEREVRLLKQLTRGSWAWTTAPANGSMVG